MPPTKELRALSFERYERGKKGGGSLSLIRRELRIFREMKEEKKVHHCQQKNFKF